MLQWIKDLFWQPGLAEPAQTIKRFDKSEASITKVAVVASDDR